LKAKSEADGHEEFAAAANSVAEAISAQLRVVRQQLEEAKGAEEVAL
jgi:hypothetical protein